VVRLPPREFGPHLRSLRMRKGMSQRALAGDFVTASYISLLESGAREPALDVIVHLARKLGVSVRELTGDDTLDGAGQEESVSTALSMILARSAAFSGNLAEARAELTALLEDSRSRESPLRVLEIGFTLLDVMFALGDHDGRYQLTSDLLAVAEAVDSPEILIKLLIDHASAAREAGHLEEARDVSTRIAAQIARTGLAGTGEHIRLLGVRLAALSEIGDTEQIPALIEELKARAAGLGSTRIEARAHWAVATALARMGQTGEVAAEIDKARSLLAETNPSLREWLRFCRSAASVLVESPDTLDRAAEYLTSARAALVVAKLSHEQHLLEAVTARYQLATGDAAGAEATCRCLTAEDDLPTLDSARLHAVWGSALRQLGRFSEAVEQWREAALRYEHAQAYRSAVRLWHDIDATTQYGREDIPDLAAAPEQEPDGGLAEAQVPTAD
jgi:transcriptional regulator with XRE-family HTH domain